MSDLHGDGSASVVVRRLGPSDFDRYSALRLEGLIECPAAFTTDAEAWRGASRSTLEAHLSPERTHAPVLGAWVGESLIGLVGMKREERRSVSHKAGLWGFYVAPQHRGQGVGRRLLTEMIVFAASVPGLRQFRAIVPASCAAALSLMDALGFERYGLERNARLVDGVFHDQAYLAYSLPEA